MRRNRLLALAILALLALATVAPTGQASGGAGTRAVERAEQHSQRAERMSQKAAERTAAKQRREAAKALSKTERETRQLATLSNEHADVEIECSRILVTYKNFNVVPDSPNEVAERVLFKAAPRPLPSHAFPRVVRTFEGTGASYEIPIAAPQGESVVSFKVKYKTNGVHGGFNARRSLLCGPIPAFQIEARQSFGAPFTSEPLSGKVGETVAYEAVVTNVGNTPMTFTNFLDSHCEGLAGGSLNSIEPFATLSYYCTHTLTSGDAAAGSYANAATVTGTPEEGEGSPAAHESNTVVVTPIAGGEEVKKEEPGTGGGTTTATTPPPAPKQQVLSSSGSSSTSTTKTGVLGFSSATIPSLRGPQGCVRSVFVVSIKSAGVSNVVFYLDGHKYKRLTSAAARKGLLSIRIDGSRLKVGAHRVRANVTMKATSSTAKAARAVRSLAVVRCRSTAITPHFTG